MNVLLTSMEYPPYVGGGATYTHDLAHDLASEGAEVTVLTSGDEETSSHEGPVRVLRSQACTDTLRSGALSPALLNVLRKTIGSIEPDVVHAHHTAPILALKTLDEAHPHPSVYTQHRTPELPGTGIKTDGKGMMAEMAYHTPGYGIWIAPSHFFAQKLVQASVAPKDISVIWPSIDYRRFAPQHVPAAKGILKDTLEQSSIYDGSYAPDEKLIVLPVVDRPRKDVYFALDALGQLDEQVQVIVTGINGAQGAVYEYARQYPNVSIIPHGYIPDGSMNSLYNAADATIVSATHEGFGLAALEAAATGGNVCVRNSPGLQEIADHISWMHISADKSAMAADIATCLAATPTYDERIDRSRDVQAAFSPQVRAQKHIEVYREVGKQEYVAQGVLIQVSLGKCAVGLVHHKDGSLSLPKTNLLPGENWHSAASRSVVEAFSIPAHELDGIYEPIPQRNVDHTRARIYTFEAHSEPHVPLTTLTEEVINKIPSSAEQAILYKKLKEYVE